MRARIVGVETVGFVEIGAGSEFHIQIRAVEATWFAGTATVSRFEAPMWIAGSVFAQEEIPLRNNPVVDSGCRGGK